MDNFLDALKRFKGKKILVIGDIILDRYLYGNTNRINPEVPHAPLVNIENKEFVLGGAANVANNLASLGANVILFGVIGNDQDGNKIKELCSKRSIVLESFTDPRRPTTLKTRIIADNHQITRFDEEKTDEIDESLKEKIYNAIINNIDNVDCIAFSDYDKGTLTNDLSQKIIKLAKEKNILVLTDPKPQNISYFKGSSLIRPNHHEACKIAGMDYENGNKLELVAKKIKNIAQCKYVIISCGKDGLFVYNSNKSVKIKANAKEPVDVTGAGDTILAGLCLGLSSGLELHQAAELANLMAGIVVGKVGTATITIEEIGKLLKKETITLNIKQ